MSSETLSAFAAGMAAAALQLSAGQLLASLWRRTIGPIHALGSVLIDLTPGSVVDVTVALLEDLDKPFLWLNVSGLVLLLGGVSFALGGASATAAVLSALGVAAGAAAAVRKDFDRRRSVVAALGAVGVGWELSWCWAGSRPLR